MSGTEPPVTYDMRQCGAPSRSSCEQVEAAALELSTRAKRQQARGQACQRRRADHEADAAHAEVGQDVAHGRVLPAVVRQAQRAIGVYCVQAFLLRSQTCLIS